MKIGGVEVQGPCEEVLVLPRLTGDIAFRARAVLDMDMFNKLVPEPQAPGIRTKDGFRPNVKDENYMKMLEHYAEQKLSYIIIKSLEPSEIEWDKVKLEDPGTWHGWTEELKTAGISDIECNRIVGCVMMANSLDEAKLRQARENFLRGQEA